MRIISNLEFKKKNYFTREDIKKHFENRIQMKNTIHQLLKKGRIVKLNKTKYFLVPIKARTGKWSDDPFLIADEMFDGKGYFIGGWTAANYWRLTDQVPMKIEIWTTKRSGKIEILNTKFIFHKTTKRRVDEAVTDHIDKHEFKILSKENAKKWLKSRK